MMSHKLDFVSLNITNCHLTYGENESMENPADTQPKRLKILGDEEIEAIYGIPRFTHEERIEYFSLSPSEKATLEQLHSIKSRIYFILQLGYFKARHLFIAFSIRGVFDDAKYIQERYFPDFELKLHDNLINCLIYDVRRYIDDTTSFGYGDERLLFSFRRVTEEQSCSKHRYLLINYKTCDIITYCKR